jgi:hypothetical protein
MDHPAHVVITHATAAQSPWCERTAPLHTPPSASSQVSAPAVRPARWRTQTSSRIPHGPRHHPVRVTRLRKSHACSAKAVMADSATQLDTPTGYAAVNAEVKAKVNAQPVPPTMSARLIEACADAGCNGHRSVTDHRSVYGPLEEGLGGGSSLGRRRLSGRCLGPVKL